MRSRKIWVHALLIFLLGFGLRIWNMAKEPPGYEEMAATLVVSRGLLDYLSAVPPDFDFAPPAYYMVARPFAWLGLELWRLRLVSVLIGSAAGVLVAVSGRKLLGGRAATLAGYVLAVHPLHVFYSQEIQPVALFTVLSLLAFHYLVRSAETNHSRHWATFDVCAVLLLHTMREALYLVTSFLLVHLARAFFFPVTDNSQRKLRRRKLFQAVVFNYAAIFLAALPWLILMPRGVRWTIEPPRLADLTHTAAGLWISGMASWLPPRLEWLALLLFVALLPPAVKAARKTDLRGFAVIVCLAGAVLLPFLNSLKDKPRFDAPREAAVALPFLALVLGALIARCNFFVRTALAALFGVVFVASAVRQSNTLQKPPFDQILQALRAHAEPSNIVAFWPDYAVTLGHYLNAVQGATYRVETAEAVLTQWAEIPPDRPVYFVAAQFPEQDPILYTFRGALRQHARTEIIWENPRGYDVVVRSRNLDRPALKTWFQDPQSLEIVDTPSSDTLFFFPPGDAEVFTGKQFHHDRPDAQHDRAGRRVVWTASAKTDIQLRVMLQPGNYVLRLHASPEFDPPAAVLTGQSDVATGKRRSVDLTLRAFEQRRLKLDREQTISLNFSTEVELRSIPVHIEVSPTTALRGGDNGVFGLKIYSISIDQPASPGAAR